MAIPLFYETMRPILEFLSESGESRTDEIREHVGKVFNTTDEEKEELLPSKRAKLFFNRVAWGIQNLKMAGLIDSQKRAHYDITDAGRQFLKEAPETITIKNLEQIDGFQARKEGNRPEGEGERTEFNQTPEEAIYSGYMKHKQGLVDELLTQVKTCNPYHFERIVLDLLLNMGYGDINDTHAIRTQRSADEGIDGIIKEDKLGLESIYVQAKRWEHTVGRQEIQKFAGALQGQRARKGVFITTSRFSREAVDYTNQIESRIVLIDGEQMAEYMVENGVGVIVKDTIVLMRVDTDYFAED